jgi:hypothetical protein
MIATLKNLVKWLLPVPLRVFEWGQGRVLEALEDLKRRSRRLERQLKEQRQELAGLREEVLQSRQALAGVERQVQERFNRELSAEDRRKLDEFKASLQAHARPVASLARSREAGVLSVLIPARAAEAFIGECLDSILGQPLPAGVELEVLVGVDACEATRAVVERYVAACPAAALKVRCLYYPRQGGSYVVQNSLLLESRGETVHIVGADDALAPEALAALWAFAGECQACTPGFILRSLGWFCDEHRVPIPGKPIWPLRGALLFTKSVLDRLGGFSPWICAADADFLRRAEAGGIPIYQMPRATYLYRRHGEQLTEGPAAGMRSELRAHYRRFSLNRLARGEVRETPWVSTPEASGAPSGAVQ